jgi:formylglycine-generating enzyme required for sulfatase activity
MRRLPLTVAVLAGLVAVALSDAAPVPRDFVDREEGFEWKGAKRTRTVRTLVLGGEKVEFVKVPKGSFLMGSPKAEEITDEETDERPQHKVTFAKPLWVGKCPVTKGQFAAFVKAAKYPTAAETDGSGWGFDERGESMVAAKYTWRWPGWEQADRHPVVNVTWNDAAAFCEWAGKEAKRPVRLPTEAEYEYFNRGGETARYFTGDEVASLDGYANVADASAMKKWGSKSPVAFDDGEAFTSAVGKYKANGFGLHDTTGNVWCWCADWYNEGFYGRSPEEDPEDREGKFKRRVPRGGSWVAGSRGYRTAFRHWRGVDSRRYDYGFRVAFTAD